jgi:signal transduction histidine kinase/CheY-like chemotaxis protein
METEDDIEKVLLAVRRSLEELEIPVQDCGINLIDGSTDPPTVHFHSMTEQGEWIRASGAQSGMTVLQFWRGKVPVYRRDLEREDPCGEGNQIRQVFAHSVRSVLDIPFAYGTLACNSPAPEAFSAQDIALMQELAAVLDEGFRRLEDLRALDIKEEQLRQAQKIEAIGHLAGGIAHDFNNLLTVINGYSAFLLEDLGSDYPRRQELEEINKAGERAAALVRQLLAFSRRQVLNPELVDLNAVVGEMDKMLRRLIDENIELVTDLDPVSTPVYADRTQLEQIIVNLAINARDAMPHGGQLTIATRNMAREEAQARLYLVLSPGAYVQLVVSDTGIGMSGEIQSRIFEPFFTTKEIGKGTGLGLAMVYGAVKQSNGHIQVKSAPGEGTTFGSYLPRAENLGARRGKQEDRGELARGKEIILLVEDEDMVRSLTHRLLVKNGYTVLEACASQQALETAVRHAGPIHLLLTDVAMPGMNGCQLAQCLAEQRPETRVIYMSGYLDGIYAKYGVSEADAVIQKPFSEQELTQRVRKVLAQKPASSRGPALPQAGGTHP